MTQNLAGLPNFQEIQTQLDKIETTITPRLEQATKEFPTVLSVKVDKGSRDYLLYRYRLNVENSRIFKKNRLVDFAGMSSTVCLDDDNAHEYRIYAERDSFNAIAEYFKQQFQYRILPGNPPEPPDDDKEDYS